VALPPPDLGLSVLRAVLERHVSLELAPKILFAALSRLGSDEELPRSHDALIRFIVGPLSYVLRERLGTDRAAYVLDSLAAALSSAADSLPPPPDPSRDSDAYDVDVDTSFVDPHDPFGDSRDTLEVPTSTALGDTLRLMIIARTSRLAKWLRAAFGAERVTASVSTNLRDSSERLVSFAPAIVIIDGQDVTDIDPRLLAAVFSESARTTLVIVWASDQPGGAAIRAAFDRVGTDNAPVPRDAGYEPMLDYIRARIG
jgi:hypothetical protein